MAGLLLAAGSGTRYGMPKALVDSGEGPWVARTVDALAGCDPLLVVVGARADEVIARLPPGVIAVRNEHFAQGMGSSLRAGLQALADGDLDPRDECDAVLVMLVDLPDVGAPVIGRIRDRAGTGPAARSVLLRAVYHGRPGHPVLIGRDHWAGVLATASADEGARRYFQDRPPGPVECGDLASGRDVDHR